MGKNKKHKNEYKSLDKDVKSDKITSLKRKGENSCEPLNKKSKLELKNDKFDMKKSGEDSVEESKVSFNLLKGMISENTYKGILDMGFTTLTEIQEKSLLPLWNGKDLIAASKTGSGKTLAFLIPAVELLHKLKFETIKETGVIILSPTRELSLQICGVLESLLKYHNFSYTLVVGGTNRKTDVKKLKLGANFLIGTPGRVLDHMKNTKNFIYKNTKCVILDEADKMLDMGFEASVTEIISLLPEKRQTMLFSATITNKIDCLIKTIFKKKPYYVRVNDEEETPTVEGLKQGYLLTPIENKLKILYTIVCRNKKKIIVFFNSCMSVKFHHELFTLLKFTVMSIHGKQKQVSRTSTFLEFCKATTGVLFCTDIAARGLDIPSVHLIIQFDPPEGPNEYIHRVGRTARGDNKYGQAILFLRPEEFNFVWHLKYAKIELKEMDFKCDIKETPLLNVEELVENESNLKKLALKAYISYLRTYNRFKLKKVFDINNLNLTSVAKSFGFKSPPHINLWDVI